MDVVKVDPHSVLHPRLQELAAAAARTVSWIADNTKAIPPLSGVGVRVDTVTTVSVTLRDAPYGWLELADDDQSFTAFGVDLNDPGERHVVAEGQATMPMALFALTVWHQSRELTQEPERWSTVMRSRATSLSPSPTSVSEA